jgi:hypothetical protein
MDIVLRLAWAVLAPLLISALLAALITKADEGAFWLLLAATLAVGAVPLLSADWRWLIRIVAVIVYLPLMAIAVIVTGIMVSCSVHGCH